MQPQAPLPDLFYCCCRRDNHQLLVTMTALETAVQKLLGSWKSDPAKSENFEQFLEATGEGLCNGFYMFTVIHIFASLREFSPVPASYEPYSDIIRLVTRLSKANRILLPP